MSQSSLISFSSLLRPISPDMPAGDIPFASADFVQLKDDRQTELNIEQGLFPDDERSANWLPIISQAKKVLSKSSKDLTTALWLCEALTKQYGFPGLADGLHLIAELQSAFWDDLHPQPDEDEPDDYYERAGVLERLDHRTFINTIQNTPLSTESNTCRAYTLNDKLRASNSSASEGLSTAQIEELAQQTPQDFYQKQYISLQRAFEELEKLGKITADRMADEEVSFTSLQTVLKSCQELLSNYFVSQAQESGASEKSNDIGENAAEVTSELGEPTQPQNAVVFQTVAPPIQTLSIAKQAEDLRTAGQIKEGLELIQKAIHHALCGRQAFLYTLCLAEYCLDGEMVPLARPILAQVWQIAEQRKLKDWEEPDVWARVVNAQVRSSKVPMAPIKNKQMQQLLDQLCLVDITLAYDHFIADTN